MIDKDDIDQVFQITLWQTKSYAIAWRRVRDMKKQEWSRVLLRYCPECGLTMSFRADVCRKCGNDKTEVFWRMASLEGTNRFTVPEEQWLEKIEREGIVARLQGQEKRIAEDLLIKRGIFEKHHVKRLASELGISERMIRLYKNRIAKKISAENSERQV